MFTRHGIVALCACACVAYAAQAPSYKLLYSPPTLANGETTTMVEVQPGLFYVLSIQTGGVIFSVTSTGTYKPVFTFPPAANGHVGTLVQGTNGKLYGAGFSSSGSYYYSLSTSGTGLQQYPFPSTAGSQWGSINQTVVAPPGEIYDLAGNYLSNTDVYGLAEIQETGTITILSQLTTSEGYPNNGTALTLGPGGNLYDIATAQQSGISPVFIFSFTPTGTYSKGALLPPPAYKGAGPKPLIGTSDGNLYGSLPFTGTSGAGQIYQVTPSGQLQVVADFPATGMRKPATLFEAADGNIYGSTINTGTGASWIFRYSLATQQLTQVYHLSGGQGTCPCSLQEGMDGKIYGVTPVGGPYPGVGTVWSLDVGLPKPLPQVQGLYPATGPVGQKVILWGNYLLGVKTVTFNGTPAPGAISTSKQSVLVSVPSGATSGPVTVTTANGSFTTMQNFTVQ